MSAADKHRLEEFQQRWKRLWSVAEPWVLADQPHKTPPQSPDDEQTFMMEREWVGRHMLAVAVIVGRKKERSRRFARGVRQLLDLATSLSDLATDNPAKRNFRLQWNHTYNRLSVAISRFEPGANRKALLEQEAALYPLTDDAATPPRPPSPLRRLATLLLTLLALWKILDLAYIYWRSTVVECARISDSDASAAMKEDCLPGFFPFWPPPND